MSVDLAKIRKKAREQGADKTREQPAPPEQEERPEPKAKAAPKPKKEKAAPAAEPDGAEPRPSPPEEEAWLPPPSKTEEPVAQDDSAKTSEASKGERLLIFTLAREKYSIPIHDIALIIQQAKITPIPNAPDFLLGILSLRGKVVSIIDAARRLGLRRQQAVEDGKIIVMDLGADHFGLLVDAIEQLVEVDLSTLEPPPEGFTPLPQEFVEGVFHHKGRAIGFLNLPMFLSFQV